MALGRLLQSVPKFSQQRLRFPNRQLSTAMFTSPSRRFSQSGLSSQTPHLKPFTSRSLSTSNGHNGSRFGEYYYAGSLAVGGGLVIYSIASGDIKEKARQLLPLPIKGGYVENISLIDAHTGALKAKKMLHDVLSVHDTVIIDGEGGIGKFSTAVDYAKSCLDGKPNGALFVFDASTKEHFDISVKRCAKGLGLTTDDIPIDTLIKQINNELLFRKGTTFFIHKGIRNWILENDYFPKVDWRSKRLGITEKHIITTGKSKVVNLAHTDNIPHLNFDRCASITDLKRNYQDYPDRLNEFLKQGYGIRFLEAIDYNSRLMIELEPYVKQSKAPMPDIISALKESHPDHNIKQKVLMIIAKDLSPQQILTLSLICPTDQPQQGLPLESIKTLFAAATKQPVSDIDRHFHHTIDFLQQRQLIKYDATNDCLYPRLLLEQHQYIPSLLDTYHTQQTSIDWSQVRI